MMKAIKVNGDSLSWETCDDFGELPSDHLEIDVVWTAVNRADLM
ncbi:MAG: NAD(P)H-quinone oxidoreductase, partial [Gammaproteobacteria bacterium]